MTGKMYQLQNGYIIINSNYDASGTTRNYQTYGNLDYWYQGMSPIQFNSNGLTPLKGLNTWSSGTYDRPTYIEGLISQTTARVAGAPVPISGAMTGYASTFGLQPNGSSSFFVDRGHLMALNLGGPNYSLNIAPQWSSFNQIGSSAQPQSVWNQSELYLASVLTDLILRFPKQYGCAKWNVRRNSVSRQLELSVYYVDSSVWQ